MNKKETRKYSEEIPLESANNKTNKIPSNIAKITRDIAMLTVFSVPSVFSATLEEKNIFLEKLHYNKIINEALSVPNAIFEKISVASSTSSTPTSVDLINSLNEKASGSYEKFALNPNGLSTHTAKTKTNLAEDLLFHFPNNDSEFSVNLSYISALGVTTAAEIADLGLDATTLEKFFLKNGETYLLRWETYFELDQAVTEAGLNNNTEVTEKINKIFVKAFQNPIKAHRVLNIKGDSLTLDQKDATGEYNSFPYVLEDVDSIHPGDKFITHVSQTNPENESKVVMSVKKKKGTIVNESTPSPSIGQISQTRSVASFFLYRNGQAEAFYDNSFDEFTDANNYYPTTNDKYKNFPIPLNFNPENLNYKIASLDTVPSPMEFACVNKNTNKWEIYSAQGYKALAFRDVKDEYKEFFQFDPKVNVYSGTFTDEADLRAKNTAKGSPLSEDQLTDLLATPSIAPLANTTDNFSAIYNHCTYKLKNEAIYGDMELKKESGIKSDGEANFSETGSEGVPILSRDQNETRTRNSGDGKIHTVKYEAAMSSVFAEMAKNSFTITTEVESSFEDALSPSAEIMKRLMLKTCQKYNVADVNNPSENVLSEMRNILGLDNSDSNPLFWNLDNDGNEKSYAEQEPWLKTRATLEVFAASLKTLCKETSNNKVYDNLVTILSQMGNTNSIFDASIVEEFLKEHSRKHIDIPQINTNTSKEIAKVFKYFADYLQAVDRANLSETKNKMIAEFPGILEFIDMDDKDENMTFTESIGILQQLFEDPRSIKAFIADENGLFLQKGTIKTVNYDETGVMTQIYTKEFKNPIECVPIIENDSGTLKDYVSNLKEEGIALYKFPTEKNQANMKNLSSIKKRTFVLDGEKYWITRFNGYDETAEAGKEWFSKGIIFEPMKYVE